MTTHFTMASAKKLFDQPEIQARFKVAYRTDAYGHPGYEIFDPRYEDQLVYRLWAYEPNSEDTMKFHHSLLQEILSSDKFIAEYDKGGVL